MQLSIIVCRPITDCCSSCHQHINCLTAQQRLHTCTHKHIHTAPFPAQHSSNYLQSCLNNLFHGKLSSNQSTVTIHTFLIMPHPHRVEALSDDAHNNHYRTSNVTNATQDTYQTSEQAPHICWSCRRLEAHQLVETAAADQSTVSVADPTRPVTHPAHWSTAGQPSASALNIRKDT